MRDYFIRKDVDPIISTLCKDINPITILLITKQGTVISQAGDSKSINTTAMAALTAGMFSATREVAKMVGEQQFSILLQQGEKRHIHISLVTEDAMMVIVFEDYRRIGMVRVEAKRAGIKLIAIATTEKSNHQKKQAQRIAGLSTKTGAQGTDNQIETQLDNDDEDGKISTPEFKEYALNLIDQIFVTKS